MKGVIIKNSKDLHLNINNIFNAINNVQNEYNWLITDINVEPLNQEYNMLSKAEYLWTTGIEVSRIINNFLWWFAVFSGFPKDISKEQVLSNKLPYADGYPGFWHNPIGIQHPLAERNCTMGWYFTFGNQQRR